jgi:hypothetical protein
MKCVTGKRRQAAILNALTCAHRCSMRNGVIVSVNEAWRQLADTNVLKDSAYGIGLNYLRFATAPSARTPRAPTQSPPASAPC